MSAPGVEELARKLTAEGRAFALMYLEELADGGRVVHITHTAGAAELLDVVRALELELEKRAGELVTIEKPNRGDTP